MATFIQEAVAPATEVGLTTFSDEAHVQRAPQALNTSQDRQAFADDLPDTQSGATDITLGLTTAAKVRARLLSSVELLTLFCDRRNAGFNHCCQGQGSSTFLGPLIDII